MIITLTPNPSLDRTIAVPALHVGEVHRAGTASIDAGGKGVNVSRALAAHERDTLAVIPAGGAAAVQFGQLLDDAGVDYEFIDLPDAVRTNITIVEDDGTTTKINEPGRESGAADAEAMLAACSERCEDDVAWVVGCGSLPPGLATDFYVALIERARTRGAAVAVDTSGPALAAAVAASPDLIKPNLEELEELVGKPLPTLAAVHDAALTLVHSGIPTVVVSLGEDGALAVTADGASHAVARVEQPLSTVGAGDCLLAGWLAAVERGATRDEALLEGVTWGAAAVALPGSTVPGPADLARVSAHLSTDLPLTLRLSDAV